MRELAAKPRLHFNYFQVLTYVNTPILLLWEGAREKVGVEFIHFLAFLQQFRVEPLGGGKTAVSLHIAIGERWRAGPFSLLHPCLFSGLRGTFVYQEHTGNFPVTRSTSIPVISCSWLFASEACLSHALVRAATGVLLAVCWAVGCQTDGFFSWQDKTIWTMILWIVSLPGLVPVGLSHGWSVVWLQWALVIPGS